jgi:hypothetical protein
MLGKKAHAVVLVVAALALVAAGLYGVKLLRDSTSAEPSSSDGQNRSQVVLRDSVLTTVGPAASVRVKPRTETARLRLVGSCLGLGGRLVVWPTGASWDAKKKRLKLTGAPAFPLGATLRVTARPLTVNQLTRTYGKDALRHVRSCRGGTSVTLVDPTAKVRRLDHRKYVL